MSLCTSNLHPSSSLSISSPTTTTPQNHLSALSGSPPLLLLLPLLLLSVSPPPTTPLALLSLQTISKAANFGFVVSRQSPSPLFQLLPAVTAALIKNTPFWLLVLKCLLILIVSLRCVSTANLILKGFRFRRRVLYRRRINGR
ncbi:BnaA03g19750D [Brassica napus]|uniref:BnaA03g19750D protein n=1 Tax=Brassica napus TaxID=3708 RepID=A0A078HAA3_BRANA|nr:BnaA03g19750D [Brassica napus]